MRQGDPLSQDIFDVGVNPLIEFLNRCREIEKYDTLSRQKFLTLAYVDDAYLILRRLASLMAALHKINLFKSVSGFLLNMNKTVAVFL